MKLNHQQKKSILPYLYLTILTLFACWYFVGCHGMFASSIDWISQHSVFPDYFRQQFYQTKEFFPEFAPSIGGGQNIYNFSYYGLYNPIILLSYLLPFVKMSSYLIAASMLSLLSSVLLFYYWLKSNGFSHEIRLQSSVLFLLASPVIYHSCHQIMFVNYMPFLCLALIGADKFWKNKKCGIYTLGVFLMILTSFYFAIGGILAVLLYGFSRYQKKMPKKTLFHFMLPVITAVLASGVLLVPTAFALLARSGSVHQHRLGELLTPDFSVSRFAYSGYGIGLTAGILIVLFVGLTYKCKGERLLSAGCLLVLLFPFFPWILNGGLYVRDKALIPFLPVLCYLAAVFYQKQKQKEISARANLTGLLFAALYCCISLLIHKHGIGTVQCNFVLCEAGFIYLFYLWYRKSKSLSMLFCPSLLCLILFGIYLNGTDDSLLEKSFYNTVTDTSWKTEISNILAQEPGLYRLEQGGTLEERKANINRIWDRKQWISSAYSSVEQEAYKTFREETFQIEQPYRNELMQSVSSNPLFQKFMGIKYKVESSEDASGFAVKRQEHTAPVIYATDRIISEETYRNLDFPWRQIALMRYAVVADGLDFVGSDAAIATDANAASLVDANAAVLGGAKLLAPPKDISLPFSQDMVSPSDLSLSFGKNKVISKEEDVYHVQAEEDINTVLSISSSEKIATKECLLFLQFDVKNQHKSSDIAIDIAGIRNKLSAQSHIYYNWNTTFTYVIQLEEASGKYSRNPSGDTFLPSGKYRGYDAFVDITFGKGDYMLSNVRCFLGSSSILTDDSLYQSEFFPNWECSSEDTSLPSGNNKEITLGNQIYGRIDVKNTGYLITSIPYDSNFELLIDGTPAAIQPVNTAFLGSAIKKGMHQICIIYHAPGLTAGKLFSCIGLLLWGLLLAADYFSSRGSCRKTTLNLTP